jgi:hypothetical protein
LCKHDQRAVGYSFLDNGALPRYYFEIIWSQFDVRHFPQIQRLLHALCQALGLSYHDNDERDKCCGRYGWLTFAARVLRLLTIPSLSFSQRGDKRRATRVISSWCDKVSCDLILSTMNRLYNLTIMCRSMLHMINCGG